MVVVVGLAGKKSFLLKGLLLFAVLVTTGDCVLTTDDGVVTTGDGVVAVAAAGAGVTAGAAAGALFKGWPTEISQR